MKKLSRTRIQNFLDCPKCFYLEENFKVKKPSFAPYLINSAVDALLKKEFDYFSYISEEFTRDFITTTYFIPQISGHGETYKKGMEALINTTAQAQTKKILEKILEDGEMYKQYSYL